MKGKGPSNQSPRSGDEKTAKSYSKKWPLLVIVTQYGSIVSLSKDFVFYAHLKHAGWMKLNMTSWINSRFPYKVRLVALTQGSTCKVLFFCLNP